MQDKSFIPFTEEMKKDYTILVPNMLPMHFKLIARILSTYGLNAELLTTTGPQIAETGLKYTHNDTCYPAVVVIGQFIDALQSGKYDLNKTALIMFQTGGGCRASNYISLIRKALVKAGYGHIPVISFSFSGLERHPGFKLTVPMVLKMACAVLYGDIIMNLVNQVRPYEVEKGAAERLADEWIERLGRELGVGGRLRYGDVKRNYERIAADFAAIEVAKRDAVKVGIVGEIFVKYSPLANNELERFLISEGAEPVVPGLFDFILYYVYNEIMEYKLYRRRWVRSTACRLLYPILCRMKDRMSQTIESHGFAALTPFSDVVDMAGSVISHAVKMGEGWLLTAEMIELAHSGCSNVVCTQPFGCLPNHICGKGMMKPIKELCPNANIVAIDYDAGASRVNQENRLKLMLANARKQKRANVPADAETSEDAAQVTVSQKTIRNR